jgi:hypothetical protein
MIRELRTLGYRVELIDPLRRLRLNQVENPLRGRNAPFSVSDRLIPLRQAETRGSAGRVRVLND